MDWLLQLDVALFELINQRWAHPLLDAVMPFASGNLFFMPSVVLAGLLLAWLGRTRGIVCLLMLLAVLTVGDGFINPTLKRLIGRPRPAAALEEVRPSVKTGGRHASMPSSHAANWFSVALVLFVYYRRSAWVTLPIAVTVGFSRVYNGAHYPGDVLAGALLGPGYAAATLVAVQSAWQSLGRRWFPLWWERLPTLLNPHLKPAPEEADEEPEFAPRDHDQRQASLPRHQVLEQQWMRVGYAFIALSLIARLVYISGSTIELSEDEAYQWIWSKHLALSYFSKPPLIAYTQFLGTSLWGDTALGIRFFSPVLSSLLGLLLLRFFAREFNARAAVLLLLALSSTLLLAVGSVLMTVDPLSVFFWTAAMLAGWRAVQPNASTGHWIWVGLWMGLGFLSKYTQLFQWLCWAVFFVLWKPARRHLRRPGPWLALLLNLACALPVVWWNAQHHWITIAHLADRAGTDKPWTPTLSYFGEFLGAEFLLLNPVFFVALTWAAIAFWRHHRHNPKLLYYFAMGAPLFLAYLLFSFRGRVLPNWIAPAVVPLFCLMAAYWDTRWRLGNRNVQQWLCVGLLTGGITVILAHDTRLVEQLTNLRVPAEYDPLGRVRGWKETAARVGEARNQLLTEGKPVFIIAHHYGLASQTTFYLPEAKRQVQDAPLVFYPTSPVPKNQFWFWPGYTNRTGQNAIFVREVSKRTGAPKPPPASLQAEFESITDLGIHDVLIGRKVARRLQLFECRNLQ